MNGGSSRASRPWRDPSGYSFALTPEQMGGRWPTKKSHCPSGEDNITERQMKIVYGKIDKDLYKIQVHDFSVIGERIRSLPNNAVWETYKDYRNGQLPSEVLRKGRDRGEVLFSQSEIATLRCIKNIEGALTSEMTKIWRERSPKRSLKGDLKYELWWIKHLLENNCIVMFYLESLVVHGNDFIAVYEPMR